MAERPDPSRRRILKAGLLATPVIVTLSARPAWAQDVTQGSLGNYASGEKSTSTPDDPFAAQPAATIDEPAPF